MFYGIDYGFLGDAVEVYSNILVLDINIVAAFENARDVENPLHVRRQLAECRFKTGFSGINGTESRRQRTGLRRRLVEKFRDFRGCFRFRQ